MPALAERERTLAGSLLDDGDPEDVLTPSTIGQCIEVLRRAADHHQAVVPWGGGTSMSTGRAPRCRKWIVLKTIELTSGLTVSPADSLVTCPAGLRWADLRQSLELEGQLVTIDPPHDEQATVGGVVAAGSFGLLRSSFGGPRDAVVALSFLTASGEAVRSGAAVVKNAAGYDLCRLLSGSWGTLGLITQVTFRTSPIPAAIANLQFTSQSAGDVCDAAERIANLNLGERYVAVRLGSDSSLLVGLAGSRTQVTWQHDMVQAEAARASLREDAPIDASRYRDGQAPLDSSASVRVWTPRSETCELARRLAVHADSVVALPAVGVACASVAGFPDPDIVPSRVRALDAALAGKSRTWLRLPSEVRAEIDPWPTPRGLERMRALKLALDPTCLFSPGRFVGGI